MEESQWHISYSSFFPCYFCLCPWRRRVMGNPILAIKLQSAQRWYWSLDATFETPKWGSVSWEHCLCSLKSFETLAASLHQGWEKKNLGSIIWPGPLWCINRPRHLLQRKGELFSLFCFLSLDEVLYILFLAACAGSHVFHLNPAMFSTVRVRASEEAQVQYLSSKVHHVFGEFSLGLRFESSDLVGESPSNSTKGIFRLDSHAPASTESGLVQYLHQPMFIQVSAAAWPHDLVYFAA